MRIAASYVASHKFIGEHPKAASDDAIEKRPDPVLELRHEAEPDSTNTEIVPSLADDHRSDPALDAVHWAEAALEETPEMIQTPIQTPTLTKMMTNQSLTMGRTISATADRTLRFLTSLPLVQMRITYVATARYPLAEKPYTGW